MKPFIITYSEFVLNETLKTHDIKLTINNVRSELNLLRYDFNIVANSNNTISLTLNNFRYIQGVSLCLENINRLLIDRHGWFPSKMIITNFVGQDNEFAYDEQVLLHPQQIAYYQTVQITYESRYDLAVKIPNKLYHLSIQEFLPKVLQMGLVPKSKSKLSKHLDRIFLCGDIQDCYHLIPRMQAYYRNRNSQFNTKWVIYEIDGQLKSLYQDPNYQQGYYSIENIPPTWLKIAAQE